MKNIKSNIKGFTLIELLITLSIMGIVIQLIYSLFLLGSKSFNVSKNRGFAQQDTRIASTFIINELRTAKNISLENKLDEYPSEEYFSISIKDGKIFREVYNSKEAEKNKYIANNIKSIRFIHIKEDESSEQDKYTIPGMIDVTIEASEGERKEDEQSDYLDFNILLENIPTYDEEIDIYIDGTNEQVKIYYSKYD